jgi:hypothetical protein
MTTLALYLSDTRVELADDVDLDTLKDDLLAATTGPPAFVVVQSRSGRTHHLLITPTSEIRIEERTSQETDEHRARHWNAIDPIGERELLDWEYLY